MTIEVKQPISLAVAFLWIGFIGAISFMESWLKFQAPGITLPLGLGIGELVFHALNTMEWVFSVIIILDYLRTRGRNIRQKELWFLIPFIILVLQTFWILPTLNERAHQLINGVTLPPSYLHFYFAGMEVVKAGCLLIFGYSLFIKIRK